MSPTSDTTPSLQMLLQPIQVQETAAAGLVCGGNVSTFRLWVERGWMPAGTKLGKYRYWMVADLIEATEKLHHRILSTKSAESRYAKAQKAARRARRAR